MVEFRFVFGEVGDGGSELPLRCGHPTIEGGQRSLCLSVGLGVDGITPGRLDRNAMSDQAGAIAAHIDQALLPEVQLLLVDAILGNSLEVAWHEVRDGDIDDYDFSTILEIAKHESIDPALVREELFPAPIDATDMQYDDLVKFIRTRPARIDELTAVVMAHPRGELVGLLELAANSLGYLYIDGRFQPAPPTAEPATEQQAQAAATAAQDINVVDAPQVTPADTPSSKKVKPAAPGGGKSAKKPNAAGKKPPKAAPAVAKPLKPAEAWPFPKSSTGQREDLAPAEDEQQPAEESPA